MNTILINFGFLVFGVTDYSGPLATLHYGAVTARAPRRDEDQAACRLLGRRLTEWTATCVHGDHTQHPANKPGERRPPG